MAEGGHACLDTGRWLCDAHPPTTGYLHAWDYQALYVRRDSRSLCHGNTPNRLRPRMPADSEAAEAGSWLASLQSHLHAQDTVRWIGGYKDQFLRQLRTSRNKAYMRFSPRHAVLSMLEGHFGKGG